MRILLLAFVSCMFSVAAAAQTSIPKEIQIYKALNVTFSEGASDCNLEHAEAYKERLVEKLAGIGITQSEESHLAANLGVTGQKFGDVGGLGGHCATMLELTFQAVLGKENIVTDNERVRSAVDRMGVFPIILYENGLLAVQPQTEPSAGGESTRSKEAALKMIDQLVDNLEEKRR